MTPCRGSGQASYVFKNVKNYLVLLSDEKMAKNQGVQTFWVDFPFCPEKSRNFRNQLKMLTRETKYMHHKAGLSSMGQTREPACDLAGTLRSVD